MNHATPFLRLLVICALFSACGGPEGGGDGPDTAGSGSKKEDAGAKPDDAGGTAGMTGSRMDGGPKAGESGSTAGMSGNDRDSSMADAAMPDSALSDAAVPDASAGDAGEDAGTDAGLDASADAGEDASVDGSVPACTTSSCNAMDTECANWTCNTDSGACEMTAINGGMACGSAPPACRVNTCQAGLCAQGNAAVNTPCGDKNVACRKDDLCNAFGSCVDQGFDVGATCGDQTSTVCNAPDTCASNGTCAPNFMPDTFSCGDVGVACRAPDKCDGAGTCVDKGLLIVGSQCGDQTATACNAADTCDATGACKTNLVNQGVICAEAESDCINPDVCNGMGACVDDGFVDEDEPCGDDTTGLCSAADTCDGSGTCLPNHVEMGEDCTSSSSGCTANDTCDANGMCIPGDPLPMGTLCGGTPAACRNADACNANGTCVAGGVATVGTLCGSDHDSDCDAADSCDATGVCKPNYAMQGAACGNQDVTCFEDDACNGAGSCTPGSLIANCRVLASGIVTDTASTPLPGVTVEILDDSGSGPVMTDSSGSFTLAVVPATHLVVLAHSSAGRWGRTEERVVDPAMPSLGAFALASDSEVAGLAGIVGSEPPDVELGFIAAIVADGAVGGEQISIGAMSAPAIGVSAMGALVASNTISNLAAPQVFFTDVVIGQTTVSITGVDGASACGPTHLGATTWPVLAHTVTSVSLSCTSP